jgi:hypothetical protein
MFAYAGQQIPSAIETKSILNHPSANHLRQKVALPHKPKSEATPQLASTVDERSTDPKTRKAVPGPLSGLSLSDVPDLYVLGLRSWGRLV